ncbi:MAG: hypothetical protein JXB88_15775, partial [Spirochaetales bacterium]|nr:hypothetical protein [Spirochaetales bacterium]
ILPGSDVVTGHRAFPASLDLGCGRSQRCEILHICIKKSYYINASKLQKLYVVMVNVYVLFQLHEV